MDHQAGGETLGTGNNLQSGRESSNPIDPVRSLGHRSEGRRRMIIRDAEKASIREERAYAKLRKTEEGTPAYYRALHGFILLIFQDSSPPITLPHGVIVKRELAADKSSGLEP
jgi:hypothetical protein